MNTSGRNTFWQVLPGAAALWGLWVLATALALGIGSWLLIAGLLIFVNLLVHASPLVGLLTAAIFALPGGVTLGMAQWLVIRKRGPRLRAWIWMSALGALPLAAHVAYGLLISAAGGGSLQSSLPSWYFALGAAAGGVLGACQWVILRRIAPRARWWIAGSILGGVLCGMAIQAPVFLGVPTSLQFLMTGFALMGSVTGITLILLLHPGPETRPAALALSGVTVAAGAGIFVLLAVGSSQQLYTLQTKGARSEAPAVETIQASSDGKLLISFAPHKDADGAHGEVTLWSAESWQELSVVEVPHFPAGRLALSPDGRLLAQTDRLSNTGAPCHTTLWDTATGDLSRTMEGCGTAVVFSPDGSRLAIGGDDAWDPPPQLIRLLDVNSGVVVGKPAAVESLHGIAFSPDGKRMAADGYEDEFIGVWDLATGELLSTFPECSGGLEALTFSPDDRLLIAGCNNLSGWARGEVKVWEIASRNEMGGSDIQGDVVDLAVSPDSRQLAVAFDGDQAVHIYDLESGRAARTLLGHTKPVTDVAFLPGSGYLASSSADGTVRIWDVVPASE